MDDDDEHDHQNDQNDQDIDIEIILSIFAPDLEEYWKMYVYEVDQVTNTFHIIAKNYLNYLKGNVRVSSSTSNSLYYIKPILSKFINQVQMAKKLYVYIKLLLPYLKKKNEVTKVTKVTSTADALNVSNAVKALKKAKKNCKLIIEQSSQIDLTHLSSNNQGSQNNWLYTNLNYMNYMKNKKSNQSPETETETDADKLADKLALLYEEKIDQLLKINTNILNLYEKKIVPKWLAVPNWNRDLYEKPSLRNKEPMNI